MRRVVVVTYYYPPSPAVGALRWAAMARYLRATGHDVTIVTSALHGPDDEPGVIRTFDLGNAGALRKLLRRPGLPSPGAAPALTRAPALLTRVVVPDSYLVSWMPAALAAVLRLGKIDCLITSGPPDSTHLLPLLLPRRPAWIADFRDGWRFESLRDPWPTTFQDRVDMWLEQRVARTADVVIGATSPIAEDFSERFGIDAPWVSNGYDPQIQPAAAGAPEDDGWLRLVHTGTLSGPRGRDPRPLLEALRAHNDDGGPRIRLLLAGRPSVEDERLIAEAGLGDALRHLGLLDRPATLRLQRDADALLLLTGTHRSEATGKLFEYLASGRPILAVARDNEAARIVRETGTGVTVDGADPAALRSALKRVADGALDRSYAPRDLERFLYPGPAEAVGRLIERALSQRGVHA
jgi:glycosyltransferase involved in cell wall biosynthesis